jgi:hypothetical protein
MASNTTFILSWSGSKVGVLKIYAIPRRDVLIVLKNGGLKDGEGKAKKRHAIIIDAIRCGRFDSYLIRLPGVPDTVTYKKYNLLCKLLHEKLDDKLLYYYNYVNNSCEEIIQSDVSNESL